VKQGNGEMLLTKARSVVNRHGFHGIDYNLVQNRNSGIQVQARASCRFGRAGATPGSNKGFAAELFPAGARVLPGNILFSMSM